MSANDTVLTQANDRLRDHFQRNRDNDYDRVHVLLLHWEDSDLPGCIEEANALKKVLAEQLSYQVQHWAIPSKDSQVLLRLQILHFLTKLIPTRSLGIIHYGGHGDDDTEPNESGVRERKSVWASHTTGGSTLSWSKIQSMLGEVKADLLLILDCCFAAQNMRNRGRIIPSNVELLASCGKGLRTPGPGRQSFTMAVIRELSQSLEQNGAVTIKDLYSLLARGDSKLMQTPIYHPLQANTSIRLAPLRSAVESSRMYDASLATLALQIEVGTPVNNFIMKQILSWLTLNPPREVAGVQIRQVVGQAKTIQRFVEGDTYPVNGSTTCISMNKLPRERREEVSRAWEDYSHGVARSATRGEASAPLVAGFVSGFKTLTSSLQNVITRNILTIPELFDEDTLESEANKAQTSHDDVLGGALKVRLAGCIREVPKSEPLRLRLTDRSPISTASNTLFCGNISEIGKVIVEYKYVDVNNAEAADAGRDRIKRLVEAMKSARDEAFRTTECLGYISNDLRGEYGVIFRAPPDPKCRILSLNWVLKEQIGSEKGARARATLAPSLGQRYEMALGVGRALLQWHMTGWVHQGISSQNILLFGNQPYQPDYSSPYLFGFEYTREKDASSALRKDLDPISDMYRHPDRQGLSPRKLHTKYHDIYSFGLLLVEIGIWVPLDTYKKRSWGNAVIKDKLLEKLSQGRLLSHEMGLAFKSAAMHCLSGDLGVDMDDMNGTRLASMFEEKVLKQLELGTKVDGGLRLT